MARRFTRTDFLILLVVIIWGVVFSVIKAALREIDPLAFTAVRFLLAAVLMVLTLLLLERQITVARADVLKVIAVGVLGVGLYQILFSVGLKYTTASNSALLIATAPIFTALFAAAARQERITLRQVFGIVLSFVGVIMLVRANGSELGFSWESVKGDVLSLLAAMAAAGSAVLAKPVLQKYSSLRVMTLGVFSAAILLLLFGSQPLLAQDWGQVSWKGWSALGYSIVFATVIAFVIWFRGIGELGPTRVAAYGYLIPLVAVLVAAIFLKEQILPLHIFGGAIILSGVLLARWGANE